MLSTKVVSSTSDAKHYFMGADNYYTHDKESQEESLWYGKGAESLGLKGNVEASVFEALLEGKLPDGTQLGVKVDGTLKHRPGFDLTFSVPKSVSLLLHFTEDLELKEKLKSAIIASVQKTLDQIERGCAEARITQNGLTSYERTHNLVVAMFQHDLSRAGDPQEHIHAVVMNMTERLDGKWRSLASQSGSYGKDTQTAIHGFIEQVRHHKHYYGLMMRAELASELKELGFELKVDHQKGFFEIEGISEASIQTFSSRGQQISEYLKKYGVKGAKAAAIATLNTRQEKSEVNRETLQALWKAKAEESKVDTFQEVAVLTQKIQAKAHTTTHEPDPSINQKNEISKIAEKAIMSSIRYLSESKDTISETEILNGALKFSLTEGISINALVKALSSVKEAALVPIQREDGVIQYVSRALIDLEKENIKILSERASEKFKTNLQKTKAYLLEKRFGSVSFQEGHEPQDKLTKDQLTALEKSFESEYRIMAIDGRAHTGKTTLLKPLSELAKIHGLNAVVLAPNKQGSLDLKESIQGTERGIRAFFSRLFDNNQYMSVASFIHQETHQLSLEKGLTSQKIIFVDKAETISIKQMSELLKVTGKTESRIIFLGDQEAYSGRNQTAFHEMIKHGMQTVTLKETFVKENREKLHETITDTLSGNIKAAFHKIEDRIFSNEHTEERLSLMAHHYAGLDYPQEALILMQSRAQCTEINPLIRQALKEQGKLGGEDLKIETLQSKNLNTEAMKLSEHYQTGDQVRFNDHFSSLKIGKGDYCTVVGIQPKTNTVLLRKNGHPNVFPWNPARIAGNTGKVEVYETALREISVGERILWKRSHYHKAITSGTEFSVVGINKAKLTLVKISDLEKTSTQCGSKSKIKTITIHLNHSEEKHFEYAYSSTPYRTHIPKRDTIIAYQGAHTRQSHQKLFYKVLSQANQNAFIYTEDKAALLRNLETYLGERSSVLDHVISQEKHSILSTTSHQEHQALIEKVVLDSITQLKEEFSEEHHLNLSSEEIAQNSVRYALSHLSEREAAFDHKAVVETALKYAFGSTSSETITEVVKEFEKSGELIRGVYSRNGTLWTTKEALSLEREIISLAKEGQGTFKPYVQNEILTQHLSKSLIREDQKLALHSWMSNLDRVTILQAPAGSGKTTLLMAVSTLLETSKTLLQGEGYQLHCLAPTHTAVKELKARGMTAQTLQSFLGEQKEQLLKENITQPSTLQKTIFAVDENSMSSNRLMRDFLIIAKRLDARVILIGDTRQFKAIESGKPHEILQRVGIHTIHLEKIIRQENPTLLKAVQETYQKDFAKAFETIQESIIEIPNTKGLSAEIESLSSPRLTQISKDYLALPPTDRAKTLIITPANQDRILINQQIREGLREEGSLKGRDIQTTILIQKDFTPVQKTHIQNFKKGDILRFGLADRGLGIQKNDYLSVTHIDSDHQILSLEKETGETILWKVDLFSKKAHQGIEVYQREIRPLSEGDLIRWTKTDKAKGLFSAELAKVERIMGEKAYLKAVDFTREGMKVGDQETVIDLHNPQHQHWDHAYAMTVYASQGKSIERIFLNLESYRKNLTSQPTFLVGLTRSVQSFRLYTDDKEALLQKLQATPGEKRGALETVGELQTIQTPKNISQHRKGSKEVTIKETTFLDAHEVTERLHEHAETVVKALLGEPKGRNGTEYQYSYSEQFGGEDGKREGGSLFVAVSGQNQGLWHSFKTGESGNLLQLIQKKLGLGFKESLQESMKILGLSSRELSHTYVPYKVTPLKPVLDKGDPQHWTAKEKKSVMRAKVLAKESVAIKGTLAEKYLREHRGISLKTLPKDLRFHPGIYSGMNKEVCPALLSLARNKTGEVQAVEAVFLDEKTAQKADVKVKKQSFGVKFGASIDLKLKNETTKNTENSSSVTYLAEGVETGLSVLNADPQNTVKVTLGKSNFKHQNLTEKDHHIVLCLDNDGKKIQEDKLILEAAKIIESQQKTVWATLPREVKDYNDLLKIEGVEAVKNSLEQAQKFNDFLKNDSSENTSKVTIRTPILKDLLTQKDQPIDRLAMKSAEILKRELNQIHQQLNPSSIKTQTQNRTREESKMVQNIPSKTHQIRHEDREI